MELFLASNNTHKQKEFSELFPDCRIILPAERGITFDPDENGNSFAENCVIKARALFEIVKRPVIADDSGLCVDILDGRPGVYTSRYAGKNFPRGKPSRDSSTPAGIEKIPQAEQNRLLIDEVNAALHEALPKALHEALHEALPKTLNASGSEPRSCRYVCALALYMGGERFFLAQETMEGILIKSIDLARGNDGFGYDPIVIVRELGKTAAELTPEEKNDVSHRGKAARALLGFSRG
jgi:XTP/dITP diphosphohydrolase